MRQRIDDVHDWGECVAIGLEKNGAFVAGVVYNGLVEGNSIYMHVAAVPGRRWLTRAFLDAAFRYPFIQMGLRRVTLLIARGNQPSRRFAAGLGFTLEGIVREGAPAGEDLCIYGLLRKECRWLKDGALGNRSSRQGQAEGAAGA